uniref:Acetyl-CoA acetyltransferase, cytosolic n=1 Tax=Schistocephalus solidus TaxID=70667 RepID=A0A0X3Q0T7_SCHSO
MSRTVHFISPPVNSYLVQNTDLYSRPPVPPVFAGVHCLMKESYSPTDVLVIAGCRTPMGRFCGSLACLSAHELGGHAIAGCIKRGVAQFPNVSEAELISHLTEVIMGQVYTAGGGQNPARRAAVAAGLPYCVPAWGVNMLCASGLKAICQCALDLQSNGGVGIAGGQESMSRCPHMTPAGGSLRRAGGGGNAQNLPVFGDFRLVDSLVIDGLEDAFSGHLMGDTAENLAHRFKISREQQDAFAFASQMKCKEAMDRGLFSAEIIPVSRLSSFDSKKSAVVTTNASRVVSSHLLLADEPPRPQTTIESLARLKPAFTNNLPAGHLGTVTAGNSSSLTDGAAAVLLCRADLAIEMGVKCPLGRLVGWHQIGCEPDVMGIGPVSAIKALLKKISWTIDDVNLFELNEAFAAQSVAVIESLGLPKDRVNVCGGAIALGHPLGCSGARILVTLLYGLHRLAHEASTSGVDAGAGRRLRGVAALCVGGGMGLAAAVEVLCDQLSADCCLLNA